VTERQRWYSVQIKGIGEVIYREPEPVVTFAANMRDHEVYLGGESVSGTPLTDADRERITRNLYHELNEVQKARIDFFNPDGPPAGSCRVGRPPRCRKRSPPGPAHRRSGVVGRREFIRSPSAGDPVNVLNCRLVRVALAPPRSVWTSGRRSPACDSAAAKVRPRPGAVTPWIGSDAPTDVRVVPSPEGTPIRCGSGMGGTRAVG
jgi:hypothetical protein